MGSSSERSGVIRPEDEHGEGPKSSSKPESLNLAVSVCFLQRAVCRSCTGVSASVGGDVPLVRLRLGTPSELLTNDTISPAELSSHPPAPSSNDRVGLSCLRDAGRGWEFPSDDVTFPGVFPLLHPHLSPLSQATDHLTRQMECLCIYPRDLFQVSDLKCQMT